MQQIRKQVLGGLWRLIRPHMLLRLLGLALFVWLLSRVDLVLVWALVVGGMPGFLLLAALLNVPLFLLKMMRWRRLLFAHSIRYSIWPAFAAVLAGFYIGLVTPGRVGDLVRVFYAKRDASAASGQALASVLLDRFIDLVSLGMAATVGLWVFGMQTGTALVRVLAYLSPVVLVGSGLLFWPSLSRWILASLGKVPLLHRPLEKLTPVVEDFYGGVTAMLQLRTMMVVGLITVLSMIIYFTQCYFVAQALGLSLTFFFVGFAVSTAALVALAPVSIAGLGTRESTFIILFGWAGLSAESAIAFSIIALVCLNLVVAAMGLLACWLHPLESHSVKAA